MYLTSMQVTQGKAGINCCTIYLPYLDLYHQSPYISWPAFVPAGNETENHHTLVNLALIMAT